MQDFEFINEAHCADQPRDIYGGLPIVEGMCVAVVHENDDYLGFGLRELLAPFAVTPVLALADFVAEPLNAAALGAGLGSIDEQFWTDREAVVYTVIMDPEGDWRNPEHALGFMQYAGVPYLVQGYRYVLEEAGAVGIAPEYELVDRLLAMPKTAEVKA